MQHNHEQGQGKVSRKGTPGLIVVLVAVLILVIWLPPYRWFFLISLGIGAVVAAILYLWHKYKPVKPEDVDRRPLKLD